MCHTATTMLPPLLLVLAAQSVVSIPTTTRREDTDSCPVPQWDIADGYGSLSGQLYANDKSKGTGWILSLDGSQTSTEVTLPRINGNHESAISTDGLTVALPHYEQTTGYSQGEGGGTPGSRVSVLDLTTGTTSIFSGAGPNPFDHPKPHGACWLDSSQLVVTAQLANGLVVYNSSGTFGIPLRSVGCSTPHLVVKVPGATSLVVTGCRCTNSDDRGWCTGKLAIVDTLSGAAKTFEAGAGSEGIAVTSSGDVWIGSLEDHYLSVFSFGDRAIEIDNLQLRGTLAVQFPLRLAYDAVGDAVGVASMDLNGVIDPAAASSATSGLTVYAADTLKLRHNASIFTERGRINMEGLTAFELNGKGYYFTGGFDSQTLVLLDAATYSTAVTIYMPRCTTRDTRFCHKYTESTAAQAKAANMSGANNWSGGYCDATMRDPYDRRAAVFDGFIWSPYPTRKSEFSNGEKAGIGLGAFFGVLVFAGVSNLISTKVFR